MELNMGIRNATVIVFSLVVAFLLGMRCGNDVKASPRRCPGLGEPCPFGAASNASSAWPKFVMQWDDARKKFVFDGQAISHKMNPPVYANGLRSFAFMSAASTNWVPAPDCPDEYSFDVAGPFGADHLMPRDYTGDLVRESGAEHGVRFSLSWNGDKGTFVIEDSGLIDTRLKGRICLYYSTATGAVVPRPVIPGGLLWCGGR
jgi:hypothetical protein